MSRGVFFPGMKCPDYCGSCPAFQFYWPEAAFADDAITCRAAVICLAAQKKIVPRSDRKPSWCPAREIEVKDDG